MFNAVFEGIVSNDRIDLVEYVVNDTGYFTLLEFSSKSNTYPIYLGDYDDVSGKKNEITAPGCIMIYLLFMPSVSEVSHYEFGVEFQC